MIDYSEPILKLKIGERKLHDLLLKRKLDENATAVVNDCIVALIEIKQWIEENKRDNHK